jgi:hypothetical protein
MMSEYSPNVALGGREIMRLWSREAVVFEILDRHRTGSPLNYTTIESEDLRLMRAACYYFGTWKAAIQAAGLNYAAIRKYKSWSQEEIVARIQELHATGHDLSWTHVSRYADPQMAASAIKPTRFGSWRAAVEAAGFDYAEVSRYRRWTPERIVCELRTLARGGQALNSKAVQKHHCALFTAGRRRFGSWDGALEAAGIDPGVERRRPAVG